MKKLIVKFTAFILILALAVIPVSVLIDPYNVFHYMNPKNNGIESNKGFIKTKYISRNHDEFDSLLFGSSRAGFVDIGYLNEKTGGRFYDMASSESLVSEQTAELKVLIKSGFVPKRVWVMVDDISCFVNPALHENMLYRVPYPDKGIVDEAEFYLKYMDLITIFNSVDVIEENAAKMAAEGLSEEEYSYDSYANMSYIERYRSTGCERLDKVSQFNPDEPQYQTGYWCDYYSLRAQEAIEDMAELVSLCEKNDIELTVLTNPLYCLTYDIGVQNGYLEYLHGLAEVTDYYNFSGPSDITNDYHYYYETSHFTPEVTRMMIDAVTEGGSEGIFGRYITKENRDELVEELIGK